jgi:radical SAM-linked protein
LRERTTTEPLPWDNIDCGVSRDFLLSERQNADDQKATADCRYDACQDCGVCDFSDTKNIFSDKDQEYAAKEIKPGPTTALEKVYRLSFTKTGRARFLSHLELAMSLTRALRRSSLALCYSAGFHPHPKISFATATSVGMASLEEYMDVTASEYPQDLSHLKKEINAALPAGMEIKDIQLLSYIAKELAQSLYGFAYDLILPVDADEDKLKNIAGNIEKFLAVSSFPISRQAKGKTVTRDIRPFVEALTLNAEEKKVAITLRHAQTGSVRPIDIIQHILGFPTDQTQQVYMIKTKTILT